MKLPFKWLQYFRQTVGILFSKGQTSKTIPPVEDITIIFYRKVRETNRKNDGV